jgi:hypothetical protein
MTHVAAGRGGPRGAATESAEPLPLRKDLLRIGAYLPITQVVPHRQAGSEDLERRIAALERRVEAQDVLVRALADAVDRLLAPDVGDAPSGERAAT